MFPLPASDTPLVAKPLRPWHVVVMGFSAMMLAFITLFLWRHEGSWRGLSRVIEGRSFNTVLGAGAAMGGGYRFEPQNGPETSAVASTARDFTPIEAREWVGVRVHWQGEPASIWVGWLDPGGRQRVIPLPAGTSSPAHVDLLRETDWHGVIRGMTVIVRGEVRQPLTLTRLELVSDSASETARRMWSEWTTFESWHGGSINYIYGGHSSLKTPMPVFAALVALYGLLMYAAFTRGWARIGHGSHIAALILIPWLMLDVRWVTNLARQLDATAELFAGKSNIERRRVDDADFYLFIERVKAKVPPRSRVYMFADEEYHRVKGGYLLRPLNSLNIAKDPSLLPPDTYREGEYIVLYRKRNVRYVPREFLLRYGDNATLTAELVDFDRGNGLFRVIRPEEAAARIQASAVPSRPASATGGARP